MEMKLLEATVFKDTKTEPVNATHIAPWIPPSCRAKLILNTEFIKLGSEKTSSQEPMGCPKKLADLIRDGSYNCYDWFAVQEVRSSRNGIHVHTQISSEYI